MIWHIFKKDVKLTWHLAALVAALHWTAVAIMVSIGTSPDARSRVLQMLLLGGMMGSIFVIMAAVQQDAISGVRQDWLVRPIRRRDLMLAKLLFVVLMVQLPIFLADLTACLVSGFSPLSSFAAAIQRSVMQLLMVNIPFLAFASLTRNVLEVVGGGVAMSFLIAIVDGLVSPQSMALLEPVRRTGLGWIVEVTAFAILLLGAAVVLGLQYFRRRTAIARIATGGFAVLSLLTWFMPWGAAFAVQRSFSISPESSRIISLNFDPGAGRFRSSADALSPEVTLPMSFKADGAASVPVYLPFRITGLPPDSALQMDHSEIMLIANGQTDRLKLGPWKARREGSANPTQTVYPAIEIPPVLYERIKDHPVRIEADYWLTLIQLASRNALPAIDGDQNFPGVGRCHTTMNDQKTAVRVACLGAETKPACSSIFLEHVPTGQRNPDRFGCREYFPFVLNPVVNLALMPDGANLPFRDSTGLAQFPVNGSMLRESHAVIQTFLAQDHFMRKLVIPEIRLSEWGAEVSGESKVLSRDF